MVHYEVSLLNTQTFQGKKVMVMASSEDHAFQKATEMQTSPRRWGKILAKVQNGGAKVGVKHKGVLYTH